MKLTHHERYDYMPLRGRPDYSWPGGKRLAVYFALNLEHFSFGDGHGAELAPAGHQPDVLNYAWRDYGNRVGAWYLLDAFDALNLPMATLVNSSLYDYAPELVAACRARGDEIVGHGRSNAERQGTLDEAAEKALIDEATARIAKEEGRPPAGWLGPWISQSVHTPDLLAEAGYGYHLDWCMDDQPIWFRCRGGRRNGLWAVFWRCFSCNGFSTSITTICRRAIRRIAAMTIASRTRTTIRTRWRRNPPRSFPGWARRWG